MFKEQKCKLMNWRKSMDKKSGDTQIVSGYVFKSLNIYVYKYKLEYNLLYTNHNNIWEQLYVCTYFYD